MKFSNVYAFALMSVLSASVPQAHAQQIPNQITFGAGVTNVGSGASKGGDEFLLRIDGVNSTDMRDGSYFVVARVHANIGANHGDLTYLDFDFHALGWGSVGDFGLAEFTLLNAEVQRDVSIGNTALTRVSLIGLRGELKQEISEDLNFILNASTDLLLGYGNAQNSLGGSTVSGYSPGAIKFEMGIDAPEHFRIVVGGKAQFVADSPRDYRTGAVICETYYDYYGYARSRCRDEVGTLWLRNASLAGFYAEMEANLTQHLSIFGGATYSVYSMTDRTGYADERVSASGWRFRGGVSITAKNRRKPG